MPQPRPQLPEALLKLSPAERIQLAEDLWDSVAARPESLSPLSDEERREIDQRLADHDAAPETAIDWDDVRKGLWSGQA